MKRIAPLLIILALAIWGGLAVLHTERAVRPYSASQASQTSLASSKNQASSESQAKATPAERPILSVYTTGQATTPQMPLWSALATQDLGFAPEIHYWKNLADLRGLLLAGKGDIWVGHVDGFAQAARLGAPVRLLVVTGWRKFFFLSSRPDVHTFADLKKIPANEPIASTPPGSPGVAVMRALEAHGGPRLAYQPLEPRQLSLEAMRGSLDLVLAPEPMVTLLLEKNPALRVVGGVEEEYGKMTGGEPVLPLAGIAVNTRTLKRYPGLEKRLSTALLAEEKPLLAHPEQGLAQLPEEFATFIAPELVRKSLSRDIIRVRSAKAARPLIETYLGMIYPKETTALPEGFFGGVR